MGGPWAPWFRKPCGTAAAARRHRRAGQPLDDDCRRAENLARDELRRKARATQRHQDGKDTS